MNVDEVVHSSHASTDARRWAVPLTGRRAESEHPRHVHVRYAVLRTPGILHSPSLGSGVYTYVLDTVQRYPLIYIFSCILTSECIGSSLNIEYTYLGIWINT